MYQTNALLHHLLKAFIACITLFTTCIIPLLSGAQPDSIFSVRKNPNPNALRVDANGGFLLRGNWDGTTDLFTGTPATEGPGTRVMWFPERSAWRAGYVDNTQWDNANSGYFSTAFGYNVRASGVASTAFGSTCVAAGIASFAEGENCTASGAASVALGYRAHTNARQGSFVFADRSTIDTLRAGVNHSANWRVNGGFRIFTTSNLSTGVTIQSGASFSNWGQGDAVISTSTGAYLSTGGVWQNASDVNRKHHFKNISGEEVLTRLRNILISEWSYKTEKNNVRHLGPTAQDFKKAFGLGTDDRSIGTVDADGVALAGVQALDSRTRSQASELATLKSQNEMLQARLTALESKTLLHKAGLPLALVLLSGISVWGTLRKRKNA